MRWRMGETDRLSGCKWVPCAGWIGVGRRQRTDCYLLYNIHGNRRVTFRRCVFGAFWIQALICKTKAKPTGPTKARKKKQVPGNFGLIPGGLRAESKVPSSHKVLVRGLRLLPCPAPASAAMQMMATVRMAWHVHGFSLQGGGFIAANQMAARASSFLSLGI